MDIPLICPHSAAKYCSDNGIILYCFRPNASHICQPCDVGLFSPLKSAWQKHVRAWQFQNIGQVFSKRAVAGVFRKAWQSVCTTVNAIGAFKQSGIYPFTIRGIDPTKIESAIAIDQVVPEVQTTTTNVASTNTMNTTNDATEETSEELQEDLLEAASSSLEPVPSTSTLTEAASSSLEPVPSTSTLTEAAHVRVLSPTKGPSNISSGFHSLKVPDIRVKPRHKDKAPLPKALSGTAALKWHAEKEEEKKIQEQMKQKRKEEREAKRKEREEEKVKKQEERAAKLKEREENKKRKAEEKAKRQKSKKRKQQNQDESTDEEGSSEVELMDDSDEEINEGGYIDTSVCAGCRSEYNEDESDEWVGCDRFPRFWHIACTGNWELMNLATTEEIEDYVFHCIDC